MLVRFGRRAIVLALLVAAACSEPPPGTLVVRAGRLLDGTGAPAREAVRLTINEGSIVAIADDDGAPAAPGEVVLDARDGTVLPGLINANAGLFRTCDGEHGGLREGVANLAALLRGGVTTVVDLGAPTQTALSLRRWVGTGRGRGPRVLVAGPRLVPPGVAASSVRARLGRAGWVVEVADGNAAREQVRDLAEAGVDLVALALDTAGGDASAAGGVAVPTFDAATVCAVVDEARVQKLRVAVLTNSAAALGTALDCKVDAIAHVLLSPVPSELAARVAQARVPLTPAVRTASGGEPPDRPEPGAAELVASAGRLRAAGAHLALGSDGTSCSRPSGSLGSALQQLVATGMTPAQAIVAATSESARFAGLDDALGRLSVGYRADLLVVDGRPDERLPELGRVRAVVIDGIVQPLDGPRWWALPSAALERAWAWLSG